MTPDRTPRIPTARNIQKLVDRLHAYANNLDPDTIATMAHRGRIDPGPDGYPTGGDHQPRSHDTPRPTEVAILNLVKVDDDGKSHWRPPHDPTGQAIWAWWCAIRDAHDDLRRAERARQLAVHLGEAERGRVNAVDLCAECNEPAPKVKRLNGAPYCHPDLSPCWWTAYNRVRRAREAG